MWQSSPTFVLASAAVDAENPAHIDYSFKTDAQRTVKLIHVNNNTWQIVSLIGIYIELSVDIPCADIHTMISDHVVIDTGDPNRMVVCQFSNAEDAERFYTLIGQNRNPDHVIRVLTCLCPIVRMQVSDISTISLANFFS